MRGPRKLEAREWDNRWHCYDVGSDPREEHDLGPEGCGDLVVTDVGYYTSGPKC